MSACVFTFHSYSSSTGFLVKPDFLFFFSFFSREKKEEEEEWDEDNEKEDEDAGVNKEMFVFLTHRESAGVDVFLSVERRRRLAGERGAEGDRGTGG